jgi:ribosomal protein S6
MKRTYEFMLILKSDFPVDDTKKRDALIAKLTKGATVKNIVTWGKKTARISNQETKMMGYTSLSHLKQNH